MGVLELLYQPLALQAEQRGTALVAAAVGAAVVFLSVILNVLKQILFKNPSEPPVVFHWFPIIGSTVTYGMDPPRFFIENRKKYGDIFTFILLGKKTTCFLGTKGNDFILNGKHKDLNAEDVYTVLTTPVFGKDVVYDCPNSKLMEQKKFMKVGLTTDSFRSYVPLIVDEVRGFFKRSSEFKGSKGTCNIAPVMGEITIYTASRALQGKEVRQKFDSSFAKLYKDLDMGFSSINFALHWAPLPHNRKRDYAQQKMTQVYTEIIQARRAGKGSDERDMISHLMESSYKDGRPVPDYEVAHMMIALLMAGQHSSASTSSWIMLRLASRPDIMEELYEEQVRVLGADLPPLTYEDLSKLTLNQGVIRETLRLHAPIHSIMRSVTSPMPVADTPYVIPVGRRLLSAPGVSGADSTYFMNPEEWDPHRWDPDSNRVASSINETSGEQEDYGFGLISKGASSPYLPFGAGRHRCIGEQFAYVQLGTLVATVVRDFKFKNPEGRVGVPPTDYASLFSKPMEPATIVWEKRTTKA